jgi:hypothetical protein
MREPVAIRVAGHCCGPGTLPFAPAEPDPLARTGSLHEIAHQLIPRDWLARPNPHFSRCPRPGGGKPDRSSAMEDS